MRQKDFFILSTLLLMPGGWSCREAERVKPPRETAVPAKTIEQVQEEHTGEWMAIPGVVGTAIGECEGRPCILVLTASNMERVRREIPPMVDGYPVVVRYIGEVRALDQK